MTKLIIDAFNKDAEDKLRLQWLVDYGRMDKTNFVSFEKYKKNLKPVDNKPINKEKILADAEVIKKAHQQSQVKNIEKN